MRLVLRVLTLLTIGAASLTPALADVYVLSGIGLPVLHQVGDLNGVSAILDYEATVSDNFPFNPPTLFVCTLAVDNLPVYTETFSVTNQAPEVPNVIIHWSTIITAKGWHTVTLFTQFHSSGPPWEPYWYAPSAIMHVYVP